jgi:large subunit ribosomal protein LP1
LTSAASVDLEPIWATLLAKALEGKNINELLSNVDAGRTAAPAVGGGALAAAGGAREESRMKRRWWKSQTMT